MKLAGQADLPVAKGVPQPLAYDHMFPEFIRTSSDNLQGITLPKNERPAKDSALDFLRAQLKEHPGEITILAIGPLTNIATLLKETPKYAKYIKRLHILGGNIDAPGNVGAIDDSIDNYVSEWNIYCDPVAADIVFNSCVPITVVPLYATKFVPGGAQFYSRLLRNHGTPSSKLVFDILTRKYDFFVLSGQFYFWDPLAAVLLTDPETGQFRDVRLRVISENNSYSGRLAVDPEGTPVRVYVSAVRAAFETVFLNTLNGAHVPS